MHREPTVRRLLEGKGEGIEALMRTEPDVAATPRFNGRPEGRGVTAPHGTVGPVGHRNDVGRGVAIACFGAKAQLDA